MWPIVVTVSSSEGAPARNFLDVIYKEKLVFILEHRPEMVEFSYELFGDRARAVLAKIGLEWDCLDVRDRCGTSRRRQPRGGGNRRRIKGASLGSALTLLLYLPSF